MRVTLIIISAFLVSVAGALAQDARSTDRSLANEVREDAARAAAREAAETAKPGLSIDITPIPPIEAEEFCVPIASINVEGITLIPDEKVNATLTRYARDCMGPLGVDQLLQSLTDLYLENGFITSRAYIPEQDLSGGILTLVVVEGFVEAIAIGHVVNGKPQDKVPESRIKRALGLKAGDPLELRNLEQGLDQLSQPASSQTSLDIQPGNQLGGSVLVLEINDEDFVRGDASLLLSAQDGATNPRLSFSLAADNLLQFNDTWSISFSGTESSNALNGRVAFALHRASFDISFGYSEQLSLISPTVELLEQTPSFGIGYSFLFNRDAETKSRFSIQHSREKTFRYANGVELTPSDVWLTRIGLERDIIGNGTFTGLGAFVARGNVEDGNAYHILDLSVRHFRGFEKGGQLYLSATGQMASAELPSAHRLFIGGTGQVRGFEAGSLSGESGLAVSAEYSWPRLFQTKSEAKLTIDIANMSPYVFADAGAVRQKNGPNASMLSIGGGMRGSIGPVRIDLGLALPIAAGGLAERRGLGLRMTLGSRIF